MPRFNAWKKYNELPAYQRGSCACCAYVEADFICNMGYHLRCHVAGQPLSLHTLFMQPRPKHPMAKAFPTLTPKAGRDATLDEVWEWHFPEPNSTEPRHTPAKFLSMFTTLAMNAENQVGIAKAFGIEAVVAALRAHPTNADVQSWGCYAIGKLAANAENRVGIAKAKGMDAVRAALGAHMSNWDVHNRAKNAIRLLTGAASAAA